MSMCVGSLILVPTYVVQYLLSLGLLNQLLTDCKMEETGPSGIQDRRGKKGCKRRLPVDEEEEELVLEGDKKDEWYWKVTRKMSWYWKGRKIRKGVTF